MGPVWKVFSILLEGNETEYVSALSAVEQASQRAMKRMFDQYKNAIETNAANLDRIKDDYGIVCADLEDALEAGRVNSRDIVSLRAHIAHLEGQMVDLSAEQEQRNLVYTTIEGTLKRTEEALAKLKQEHEDTEEYLAGRILELTGSNDKLLKDSSRYNDEEAKLRSEMEGIQSVFREVTNAKKLVDTEITTLRSEVGQLHQFKNESLIKNGDGQKQSEDDLVRITMLETKLKQTTDECKANEALAESFIAELTEAKQQLLLANVALRNPPALTELATPIEAKVEVEVAEKGTSTENNSIEPAASITDDSTLVGLAGPTEEMEPIPPPIEPSPPPLKSPPSIEPSPLPIKLPPVEPSPPLRKPPQTEPASTITSKVETGSEGITTPEAEEVPELVRDHTWVTFDDVGEMHESKKPPTEEEIVEFRKVSIARASTKQKPST
jgi:hypothetical protein